ncbi:hypothetical protein GCM10010967_11950 [Dyadobacter beijingensis]|uniref:Uncharacterized protein n=1 Tax=Dyadobacter beijingensis TaxID=365489 RepID=A0ABQ2HL73_9BACT|nr:hypothetical protein [Dyadobacter beijingensis]GGM81812.1 hypothetical protein GCM10010967_11950 [Dyadobacter beijingensis]
MPWNPPTAEIEGIIDGNLKSSPPAPPQTNTAAVVRSMLKSMWGAMATGVSAAVASVDAGTAGMIARSLSVSMDINVRGDVGDDSRSGIDNGTTATGAVKTLARVAALASGKCHSLSILINSGNVIVDADVSFNVPEIFIHVKTGATLTVKKRTITDSNSVVVGEGNYRIVMQCNNANIRVNGSVIVEGGTGTSGLGDQFFYRWYQGAFTVTTPAFMKAGNRYQSLNVFVESATVTVGDNAYFANYGGAGLNPNEGAPSRLAIYSRTTTNGTFTLGTGATESTLVGDRTLIRTFTPTSSTDARVSEGELVADSTFLYQKRSGVIKKIAWTTF